MNQHATKRTSAALALLFATVLYVALSGTLSAREWKGCCQAANQCQMAHYRPCDSAEDCQAATPCCDEYFSCLDDGYPEG